MEHYLCVIRECLETGMQPEMPSGRYHPVGYLRICDSVLSGTDEIDGGI